MSDGKIHLPARERQPVTEETCVKLTPEAYNTLVGVYNKTQLPLKHIASLLIIEAEKLITYDEV